MCDDNSKPFIDMVYSVLSAPHLCDRIFPIFRLTNFRHICLFDEGVFMVFFIDNERNTVTLPHRSQLKHSFLDEMKENPKPQKQIPNKKVSFEWLYQRLGHRSTRSLLAWDNEIVWQKIELRVYSDPLSTSCQISTINQNYRSNTPLNPKTPFKWVFMGDIPSIPSKSSTKETSFSKYLLIVDAYSKIPKLYGMENVTTE